MSLRETISWISVLTTIVVWTYYFGIFWSDVAAGRMDGWAVLNLFITCLVITVVVMIVLTIIVSIVARRSADAPPDEMERAIEARADSICLKLLEILVPIILIAGLLNVDAIKGGFPGDPAGSVAIIFANAFMGAIVVVELVRETIKIVLFRMAA